MAQSIFSIIVLYKTNLDAFKKILWAHQDNFSNIILVNNSPEISLDSLKTSQVTIINNPDNIGLSSALNVGILEAKKQGAKMAALFDQDTLLPDDFVQNMLKYIHQPTPKIIFLSYY